jgi:antitoxin component HigA of HigAB toxin-antitoxin module
MIMTLPIDNNASQNQMSKRKQVPNVVDQLRQAIGGCGVSLNQLAKATGVHRAQLSRFLRGERTLTLTAVAKLCAHLGLQLAGPGLNPEE